MGRIALYLGDECETADRTDLRPYFLAARALGLRIVTLKLEVSDTSRRRPILESLVNRMTAGEFEAIVAVMDTEASAPSIFHRAWSPLPVNGP
jgi:hypothetical protein